MARMGTRVLVGALLLALLVHTAHADEGSHKYEDDEPMVLWYNKVGPFHNPQETYKYYKLPFCKVENAGARAKRKFGGLGEMMEGNQLVDSQLDIRFKRNVPVTRMCSMVLTKKQAKKFAIAARYHYWYQMYFDELPVWGMVGEVLELDDAALARVQQGAVQGAALPKTQPFVYTHKQFSIAYNMNQVIQVNLTYENPQPVKEGAELTFTYGVSWARTREPFGKRFQRYLDYDFFHHQVHWFSIFNSFMMVIFLVMIVSIILMRTLNQDMLRYTRQFDEIELGADVDETGWKLLTRDVFRAPQRLLLFCALYGSGWHLLFTAIGVAAYGVVGTLWMGRGAVATSVVVGYALSSAVGGFVSGGFYLRHGGTRWIRAMLLTSLLVPAAALGVAVGMNTVALMYSSMSFLSFWTVVTMCALWLFVSFPLSVCGTLIGRQLTGEPNHPCPVNALPREVPRKTWPLPAWAVELLGGLLPFATIFIEVYFVFTAFWNYKFYYVYGFLMLVFVVLIIVTVCTTIVSTYFYLNAEDWRWAWTSWRSAASTGVYVFLYSVYYFHYKTKMWGLLQTAYYFGYMGLVCTAISLVCGTVGYLGSSIFIHRIYSNVSKFD